MPTDRTSISHNSMHQKFLALLFAALCLLSPSLARALPPGVGSVPLSVMPPHPVAIKAAKLLGDCLTLLYEKSSDTDTQYYDSGIWHAKNDTVNWASNVGVGTAAATLWKWQDYRLSTGTLPPELAAQATPDKQAWLHRIAVETMDRMLQDHQNPDGSLGVPDKPETYFASLELAVTDRTLGDSLDAATQTRWKTALTRAIDYLVTSTNLPNPALTGWKATDGWYTNGNIELGESTLLYLTWQITGDPKYQSLFSTQWHHTLTPDPVRWPGFGLVIEKAPTRDDGSDGIGYMAESGPDRKPGFDPGYAEFSTTIAARFYALTGFPGALRVLNLSLNKLLPRVDQTTWVLDATNGTRHSLKYPFADSGLPVTAWTGDRPEYLPLLDAQFDLAAKPEYHGNAFQNWGSPGLYRGYGCNLATFLLADMPRLPG